jgi:hypothetical protein
MAELEKAFLKFEGRDGPKIDCLFNPEKIVITKKNSWKDGSGGDTATASRPKAVPVMEFAGAESGSMSLDLIFDTSDTGKAVTDYTNKLLAQMEVSTGLPGRSKAKGNERPPYVVFHWGQLSSFPCVITEAKVSFEFFSSSGVPLRASVGLSMTQAAPSNAFTKQNPTSGTPTPHRIHRVQRGETLDRISALYYGDSTRWRTLASANGIEDPLGIRPGTLISVPELGS